MPELPEVEIATRHLRSWLDGRRIVGVDVPRSRVLRGLPPARMSLLVDRRFLGAERRGKWMLLSFDEGAGLLSHLGMTGKWHRRVATAAPAPHTRATFVLDDGHALDFRDPRMFGQLTPGPIEALRQTKALLALGPEPLEGIDEARLAARLGRTGRSIKEALMDQGLLAGLGNIHVGESLFRARLHPGRPSRSLGAEERGRLIKGIEASLRHALAAEEGPEPLVYVEEGGDNPFLVYGRKGEPCPECGTAIARIVQGGRSTFYCPRCQAAPRARAKKPVKARASGRGRRSGAAPRGRAKGRRRRSG